MNKRSGYLILAVVILLLFTGCGSSSGGGGGAAASTTTLTSDKSIALANGTDPVSPERVTFTAASTPGSPVSFVITAGTGSLINPAAATDASGNATVQLQRDPITGVNTREDVTVTATAAGASQSRMSWPMLCCMKVRKSGTIRTSVWIFGPVNRRWV